MAPSPGLHLAMQSGLSPQAERGEAAAVVISFMVDYAVSFRSLSMCTSCDSG